MTRSAGKAEETMTGEKMKKSRKVLLILALVLVALWVVPIITNKAGGTAFDQLPEDDRALLEEYNRFCQSDTPLWQGYQLKEKSIVILRGGAFSEAYLVSPDANISSIYAQKISLPEGYDLSVYRIAKSDLKRLAFLNGNFNTKDKSYSICGQEAIFYVKTDQDSFSEKWNSKRFMPFLAHEAFHYYAQADWPDPTFRGLSYSEPELDLLHKEYEVLDRIHALLKEEPVRREELAQELKNYDGVMQERIAKTDGEKLKAELGEETVEGTADYVGIKAAKAVDYDLDVMYFTNTTDIRFSDIVPSLRQGIIDQGLIGDKMVYESGALLCFAFDALGLPWQEKLNANGPDHWVTLYDLAHEFAS